MKVIKRDGRAVEYDSEKIEIAIQKANKEVRQSQKATIEEIQDIIKYIEELDKKRILVEDIQDIIEQKLMEKKRYLLAKKYIVYRYTRALVRKQNTTDASILGLIKNKGSLEQGKSNNIILASKQRDYIAGEVSRDLTKRMLLPEKITKAHEDGILYFHNADFFLQPIINSCVVNISDMLENGTVINNQKIEPPKTFEMACIVLSQIIAIVAANQYGEQYINIKCLGKYLKRSHTRYVEELNKCGEKLSSQTISKIAEQNLQEELKLGLQVIQYQINTLMVTNGNTPLVKFLVNKEDEKFKKENAMIIEQMQKHKSFDLVFITEKEESEYLDGTFNQGRVSINLAQIGQIANGDEAKFWSLLDERLELCYEALMCRYYALVGTLADASPIHWKYGAISRLKSGEKIDDLLKKEHSTLTLGYMGMQDAVKSFLTYNEKHNFEIKVIKKMQDTIKNWRKETDIKFELRETFHK